jgi:hypothetical protein
MRQANNSEGFEARMNVLVTKANGSHPLPIKVAVIGQFLENKQRLLIRGISPDAVRKVFFATERNRDNKFTLLEYVNESVIDQAERDPFAKIFNTGMVPWDMFSPWWDWGRQELQGSKKINGHDCTLIHSWTDEKSSVIREVESCVDIRAKLSLWTSIFGGDHELLRTYEVIQWVHKGNGKEMMAKKLRITDVDKTITELEVYAGDEEFYISEKIFSMFDVIH